MNRVPDVVNNSTVVLDTTAPTLSSATVHSTGNSIELVFSEAYTDPDGQSEAVQFYNTLAGTLTVTADSATVGFDLVTSAQNAVQGRIALTHLSPAITQGQAVVVTYTDPTAGDDAVAIEDAAGNETATFRTGVGRRPPTSPTAPPSSLDTTPPTLSSATVLIDRHVGRTRVQRGIHRP